MSNAVQGSAGHGEHHDHPEWLAHHFDTPQQQFETGKLGMWVFLAQEVLFFSGLFCAYAIYRANHPEVFQYAHHFLDTTMGALNTIILLTSSLTAAWAVRSAQLNNRKGLVINLVLTTLFACGFLVVKYFEYGHKIHEGLLPGALYSYDAAAHAGGGEAAAAGAMGVETAHGEAAAADPHAIPVKPEDVKNVHIFFSIYFMLTGLHGLHVLIGVGIFIWLILRAVRGDFNEQYFGPIDFSALYWHLVDLIWIYLFPLLYLIES